MKRATAGIFVPLASGLLLAFSFPTYHFHGLAWAGLIPLLLVTSRASALQGALRFFTAGWVFYAVLLQWLMANIFWAGGWAIIGYLLLCTLLSLFWGLTGLLWVGARRQSKRFAGAACLAALWAGMEWLQQHLFTGFGWGALGYSQGVWLPVAQWAAIGGVGLLSFVVVLANGLIALTLAESRGRAGRLVTLAVLAAVTASGGHLLVGEPDYESKPFTAGIFQSDFSQEMKWDNAYTEEMVVRACHYSKRLAEFEEVDCFFWPEALVMRHFEREPFWGMLTDLTGETGTSLFAGTVRIGGETRGNYNSVALISPEGQVEGTYDKVHLAPFGEYVPLEEYLPFLKAILFGSIDAGAEQKLLNTGGRALGPLICFEVLFGHMSETLRGMGAETIVVVTNLAWFGHSNAVAQELEVARMRAIETRLPVIHAANTGVSGVFDPWGRFRPVDAYFGYRGRYVKNEAEDLDPRTAMFARRVGALSVPAPGRHPLPFGRAAFPWFIAAVSAFLLVASVVAPDKPPPPPETEIPVAPAPAGGLPPAAPDIVAPGPPL